MFLFILLFSVISGRSNPVIKEHVDLIEYNHYHDSNMNLIFDQVIFYNWSSQRKRFDVIAYRLVKSESQIPVKKKKGYLTRWHDNHSDSDHVDVLREVTSSSRRETYTQYDPEGLERNFLSQHQRIGLKNEK